MEHFHLINEEGNPLNLSSPQPNGAAAHHQHDGGSGYDTDPSHDGQESITESTPLIQRPSGSIPKTQSIIPTPDVTKKLWPIFYQAVKTTWVVSKSYKQVILPILAMVTVIFGLFLIFIYKTESVLQSAADFDLTNFEVVDISDSGMRAWVSVSLAWDYTRVNWILKALFYPALSFIGAVSIDNTDPVSVYINLPQSPDAHFYNPLKCHLVLPLDIDFSPSSFGQSLTFPVDLDINPYDATKVYNDLLWVKEALQKPTIQVSIVLQSKFAVSSGKLSYGEYAATIRKELLLDPSNVTVPDYTIDDFSISSGNDSISGNIDLTFAKPPVYIRSTIGKIEWDVYIPGCENNLLFVGSLVSGETYFEGLYPFEVNVKGIIPELSKKLQKFCPDGFSPVNKFAKKALEDNATVFLKARLKSDINQGLPTWFFIFLSNNFQPVTVDIKELVGGSPGDEISYKVLNANILITNDAEVLPQLYSDTGFRVNLPTSNANNQLFNLSKIYGDLCFVYEDEIFLKVYLHSWQDIQTDDDTFAVHIRKSQLDIIDEDIVSELILRYLDGQHLTVLGKAMLDIDVKTPIFDTIFQRIEHEVEIPVQGQSGLVNMVDLRVNGLSYISTSTESQLRFFTELEVTNPLKVGGGFEFMNLHVEFNGTTIGNIELTEAIIESNWTATVRPILRLKADDNASREAINNVISEIISGKEPVVIVKGHEKSCKVPAIAKVLSNIALPFKTPTISGSDPSHPGFIVSTTFHLLKSEIEITAYNPIDNQDALLNIKQAKAMYEDIDVAYIEKAPMIRLPPGVSTTQKIPVRIATDAAGDLLRKAMNSNLTLHSFANFDVVIGQYLLNLDYEGDGVEAIIKL